MFTFLVLKKYGLFNALVLILLVLSGTQFMHALELRCLHEVNDRESLMHVIHPDYDSTTWGLQPLNLFDPCSYNKSFISLIESEVIASEKESVCRMRKPAAMLPTDKDSQSGVKKLILGSISIVTVSHFEETPAAASSSEWKPVEKMRHVVGGDMLLPKNQRTPMWEKSLANGYSIKIGHVPLR